MTEWLIERLRVFGRMGDKYVREICHEAADEIESLRQQLAAAIAACKLKDSAIQAVLCDPEGNPCFAGSSGDRQVITDAIAIQPDDSALKAWLGESVARLIPVSLPDGDRVWARTFEEYSQESSEKNMYRNGLEIPLYSPKGLVEK